VATVFSSGTAAAQDADGFWSNLDGSPRQTASEKQGESRRHNHTNISQARLRYGITSAAHSPAIAM
jgi:hypothetical protein